MPTRPSKLEACEFSNDGYSALEIDNLTCYHNWDLEKSLVKHEDGLFVTGSANKMLYWYCFSLQDSRIQFRMNQLQVGCLETKTDRQRYNYVSVSVETNPEQYILAMVNRKNTHIIYERLITNKSPIYLHLKSDIR